MIVMIISWNVAIELVLIAFIGVPTNEVKENKRREGKQQYFSILVSEDYLR